MRRKCNMASESNELFEKSLPYRKRKDDANDWNLPSAENPLFASYYQYENLQKYKKTLNGVKSQLNDYTIEEWNVHTNRRDPSGKIIWRLRNETKVEFVTIAWSKFFECLHRHQLITSPVLNTLHLCEAPGAFITALNHFLHSTYKAEEIKWQWRATTLNPYYEGNPLNEMVIDDRLIFHTFDNWLFHTDFTGNLMNVENIDDMAKRCAKDLPGNNVQLITADGSIDCAAQPDCQEELVTRLFFAEAYAALTILGPGGNFVIKMFTMFEASSVSLLYMLNCVFETVHTFKPATSKRGNSEIYIICLNYQKQLPGLPRLLQAIRTKLQQPHNTMTTPLFAKPHIPTDFLRQHTLVCQFYMKLQVDAIQNNIYAYESHDRNYSRYLHNLRELTCSTYYSRYKVQPIAEKNRLVLTNVERRLDLGICIPVYGGSYTEREMIKQGDILKQIYCLRRELNQLEKCPNGVIEYKHEQTEHTLHLTSSASIDNLQSSLFASEPVLLLRSKILHIFEIDPIWQIEASCTLKNDITLDYTQFNPTEPFHETQQRFFVTLLENLLELKSQRIVFHKFAFLSHYSVTILLFLADSIYSRLQFENNDIKLEGLQHSDCTKQLTEVLQLLGADKHVHSIFNIKQVHKTEFSRALLQHNNNILLNCYRTMLDEDAFPRRTVWEKLATKLI